LYDFIAGEVERARVEGMGLVFLMSVSGVTELRAKESYSEDRGKKATRCVGFVCAFLMCSYFISK